MGTGRERIEVARQEERKLTRLADTPGDLACLIAGAEIEIGACRPDNGGTSVLGNHGAAEWRACVHPRPWEIRLNEKPPAVEGQCFVLRDGNARPEAGFFGGQRLAGGL